MTGTDVRAVVGGGVRVSAVVDDAGVADRAVVAGTARRAARRTARPGGRTARRTRRAGPRCAWRGRGNSSGGLLAQMLLGIAVGKQPAHDHGDQCESHGSDHDQRPIDLVLDHLGRCWRRAVLDRTVGRNLDVVDTGDEPHEHVVGRGLAVQGGLAVVERLGGQLGRLLGDRRWHVEALCVEVVARAHRVDAALFHGRVHGAGNLIGRHVAHLRLVDEHHVDVSVGVVDLLAQRLGLLGRDARVGARIDEDRVGLQLLGHLGEVAVGVGRTRCCRRECDHDHGNHPRNKCEGHLSDVDHVTLQFLSGESALNHGCEIVEVDFTIITPVGQDLLIGELIANWCKVIAKKWWRNGTERSIENMNISIVSVIINLLTYWWSWIRIAGK